MKYFVVIALAGLLLMLFLYRKLRPYLLTLRNFIHNVRQFQAQATTNKNRSESEKLICCASCGVWVPQSRALPAAGSSEVWYCTDECRRRKRKASR